MEEIFSLLEGFDLQNFIPKLDSILGWVELGTRVAVLAGPIVLFVLGLWYFLLPPKEANHYVGFRTFWGMSSVSAWRFTQKVAGVLWGVLGLVLTIIAFLTTNGYREMEIIDILWSGITCLLWQGGLVIASIVLVNIAVFVFYDFKGRRRSFGKK